MQGGSANDYDYIGIFMVGCVAAVTYLRRRASESFTAVVADVEVSHICLIDRCHRQGLEPALGHRASKTLNSDPGVVGGYAGQATRRPRLLQRLTADLRRARRCSRALSGR